MSSGLAWHPRHPDLQRPSRREDVVQYGDPSEPVFLDEAEVLPDETFDVAPAHRLPLPARSGPRLDPEATARVGRRLQQEREELVALRRAGLIDNEEETREQMEAAFGEVLG